MFLRLCQCKQQKEEVLHNKSDVPLMIWSSWILFIAYSLGHALAVSTAWALWLFHGSANGSFGLGVFKTAWIDNRSAHLQSQGPLFPTPLIRINIGTLGAAIGYASGRNSYIENPFLESGILGSTRRGHIALVWFCFQARNRSCQKTLGFPDEPVGQPGHLVRGRVWSLALLTSHRSLPFFMSLFFSNLESALWFFKK